MSKPLNRQIKILYVGKALFKELKESKLPADVRVVLDPDIRDREFHLEKKELVIIGSMRMKKKK